MPPQNLVFSNPDAPGQLNGVDGFIDHFYSLIVSYSVVVYYIVRTFVEHQTDRTVATSSLIFTVRILGHRSRSKESRAEAVI